MRSGSPYRTPRRWLRGTPSCDLYPTDRRSRHPVLDGVELQWLLGADIDLHALVAAHLDQAITRWTAAPAI